jgi:cytochrome P450
VSPVSSLLGHRGDADAAVTAHDTYVSGVPYAAFERLRARGPVVRLAEAEGGWHWAVLDHALIAQVGRDWERFTTTGGIRLEEMDDAALHHRRTLMETDPPEHTRLRRILQKGFTPRVVAGFEDSFRLLVQLTLHEAIGRGVIDFADELSKALPVRLLCRLLGIPDSEADRLVAWTDRLVSNTDPEFSDVVVDRDASGEYRLLPFRSPAALEVFHYAEQCALERRARPSDDVISMLLDARIEGEPLTDLEFKNFFTLLMVAGNETTRHAMNHAVTLMIDRPETLATLRTQGGSERAVEEFLRAASVTMHFRRTATTATTLGPVEVSPGDKVVMWYVASNVDPTVFPDPHRLDLTRNPNPHHAFGVGPHSCLGAAFARLELRVLIEELAAVVSRIEVRGPVERLRSNFHNGNKRIPLILHG